MQPPAIPLRAGPSGPLIDLSDYVFDANGMVAIRRVWKGTVFEMQPIPGGVAAPGTMVVIFDVTWGTQELALHADQRLAYWGIFQAAAQYDQEAADYPTLAACLGWRRATAAPGAFVSIEAARMPVVPLNLGVDYTFTARGGIQFLRFPDATGGTPLDEGTNQVGLGISNNAVGVACQTELCGITLVELVGQRSLFTSTFGPIP